MVPGEQDPPQDTSPPGHGPGPDAGGAHPAPHDPGSPWPLPQAAVPPAQELLATTGTLDADWDERLPFTALRYTLGVALVLVLGTWWHGLAVGVVMASGAVNAAGVSETAHHTRPRTVMAVASLALAACAFLGSVTSRSALWSSLALALCAVVAGLSTGRGSAATSITSQALIGFITLGHFAPPVRQAAPLSALILVGGAAQVLLDLLARSSPAHRLLGKRPTLHRVLVDRNGPDHLEHLPPRVLHLAREMFTQPDRQAVVHTVRLVSCLVLAHLAGLVVLEQRGYWLALTVLIVMKPTWQKTLSQGINRWIGTLAGSLVAGWALQYVPLQGWWKVVGISLTCWAMLALQKVNYTLYVTFMTIYVVTFLDVLHANPHGSATMRILDTSLGGLLCLGVHLATRRLDSPAPRQS